MESNLHAVYRAPKMYFEKLLIFKLFLASFFRVIQLKILPLCSDKIIIGHTIFIQRKNFRELFMIIAPDPWNILVKLTVNRLRLMGAIVLSFFLYKSDVISVT